MSEQSLAMRFPSFRADPNPISLERIASLSAPKRIQLKSCYVNKKMILDLENILDDPGLEWVQLIGNPCQLCMLEIEGSIHAFASIRYAATGDRFPSGVTILTEVKRADYGGTMGSVVVSLGKTAQESYVQIECHGERADEMLQNWEKRIVQLLSTQTKHNGWIYLMRPSKMPSWLRDCLLLALGSFVGLFGGSVGQHLLALPHPLLGLILVTAAYPFMERFWLSPYIEFDSPDTDRRKIIRRFASWAIGGLWIALIGDFLIRSVHNK